jgi:hypothetical protein
MLVRFFPLFCCLLMAFSSIPATLAGPPPAGPDLHAVVQRHLQAIAGHDLPLLLTTITTGPELTLILPNGELRRTRAEYVALHREWFAETDWAFTPEVVSYQETAALSTVLLRVRNEDKAADGRLSNARSNFLTLIFAIENGEWRLVFDQNTRIVEPGK